MNDLRRPYWDADVYIYRVTSPQARRLRHSIDFADLIAEPLAPVVTAAEMETVQIQRFARVSRGLLHMSYPNKYSSVPYVPDDQLRALIVRGAIVEWQEKTGRLEDAAAFKVELMDDREEPWKPAYPRSAT